MQMTRLVEGEGLRRWSLMRPPQKVTVCSLLLAEVFSKSSAPQCGVAAGGTRLLSAFKIQMRCPTKALLDQPPLCVAHIVIH